MYNRGIIKGMQLTHDVLSLETMRHILARDRLQLICKMQYGIKKIEILKNSDVTRSNPKRIPTLPIS